MTPQDAALPTGRVARKREAARARIVAAARRQFRERGVDDVTISDITRDADVGHGSFYTHFNSKYEVLVPIMMAEAADLDATARQQVEEPDDPASVLAHASRYVGYSVVRDPLWRWFLRHSGLPADAMREAFGRFGLRDLEAGLAAGRFTAADLQTTSTFCLGGYISVLLAALDAPDPRPLIDLAAEHMLRVLGLGDGEARRIAHRPLPARSAAS